MCYFFGYDHHGDIVRVDEESKARACEMIRQEIEDAVKKLSHCQYEASMLQRQTRSRSVAEELKEKTEKSRKLRAELNRIVKLYSGATDLPSREFPPSLYLVSKKGECGLITWPVKVIQILSDNSFLGAFTPPSGSIGRYREPVYIFTGWPTENMTTGTIFPEGKFYAMALETHTYTTTDGTTSTVWILIPWINDRITVGIKRADFIGILEKSGVTVEELNNFLKKKNKTEGKREDILTKLIR
jgi:hypothetical protein